MKLKEFIISNIPDDEELLLNFIEGTIDVCVKRITYSPFSPGTALVSLEEYTDLKNAAKSLKENDELLGIPDKVIEVHEPVKCHDKIIVENLDENILSMDLLKMYIESTFKDGYEVVSECKHIPESNMAFVTFTDRKVVDLVLEREDHTPLPSINYHIQVRPFYENFHLLNQIYQRRSSEEVNIADASKENSDCLDGSQENVTLNYSVRASSKSCERKQSSTNSNCRNDDEIVEEEETLNLSNIRWNLLEDKLKALPCQLYYDKENEVLKMHGVEVIDIKSNIIDLVRSLSKCTLKLSQAQRKLFNNDKIRSLLETFLGEKMMASEFGDDSLTIHSFGNSEEQMSELRERFLHSICIELPEETPNFKIRECYNLCSSYLLIISIDDDNTKLTLTGVVEDVTLASSDLHQILEECRYYKNTFKVTGNDAMYVQRFEMSALEHLFQNAVITKKEKSDEEICFEYKCQKSQIKPIEKQLTLFVKKIKKSVVDMGEYSKEEIALVRNYLKIDKDTLEEFQNINKCCVVTDGCESSDFLSMSKSSRKKQKKDKSDARPRKPKAKTTRSNKRQKKEIRISTSCKLQIKPFGNIIREKTDLLVCGVDESLSLKKTMVSKAFLHLDNSLQSQMAMIMFSANNVHIEQRQLPNTKSKAIAFVILKNWQQGISDQNLDLAVNEILDSANRMGLSSVSFPPLGFGRAFKFPVRSVAQTFINAIDSFMKLNAGNISIKLINLLAPDRMLFSEMSKISDSVFMNDKSSKSGSHDDSSDNNDEDDDDDDDDTEEEETGGAKALGTSSEEDDEEELQMEALESDQPLAICIVHAREENMPTKFKLMIKKQWLYVEDFKTDKLSSWPPPLLNEVIKAAKSLGVWVSRQDSRSKGISCQIRGKKQGVLQLKSEIYEKMFKSSINHGKNLMSPNAPKRGTKKFVEYAGTCDDTIPSYWKLKDDKKKPDNLFVSVDDKTSKAIEKVFKATWDQSKFGSGNDAANMPPISGIKVIEIKRLENPRLFVKYSMRRKWIFNEMAERDGICTDVSHLRRSKGSIETMKKIPGYMKKDLYDEINEVYLFHGTKGETVKSISKQGMDIRLSNKNAMFGQGVYMAESSTKSDQYSDPPDRRVPNGTNLTMILTRATLGDVFLCDDKHESLSSKTSQKLRRPPCVSCLKDVCHCASKLFHSVMGDGKWLFREFVVYDNSQCYPEYFITYQRI